MEIEHQKTLDTWIKLINQYFEIHLKERFVFVKKLGVETGHKALKKFSCNCPNSFIVILMPYARPISLPTSSWSIHITNM